MPDPVVPPYRFGVDDVGADVDGAIGGENPATPDPNDGPVADPTKSEGEFRRAVLILLTEIRDALLTAEEDV